VRRAHQGPGQPGGEHRHPAGGTPGSLLGGGSEFAVQIAVQIAVLVAWLITAANGGYVLVRWWRAGGRLRRQMDTAVPPVVTLGHPGLGLLGLVL